MYTRMKRYEEKALRENSAAPVKIYKHASLLTFLDAPGCRRRESSDDDADFNTNQKLQISRNYETEDLNSTNNTQTSFSCYETENIDERLGSSDAEVGDNDNNFKLEITKNYQAEDLSSRSSYNEEGRFEDGEVNDGEDDNGDDVDCYYNEDSDSNNGAFSSKANSNSGNTEALENLNVHSDAVASEDPLFMRNNTTFIFFESLAHKVLSAGITQQEVDTLELKVAAVVYKEIANFRNRKRKST
ncbi:probable serine/threonine-protein kinase mps1 isoform X2 [Eurosta solidaginis]